MIEDLVKQLPDDFKLIATSRKGVCITATVKTLLEAKALEKAIALLVTPCFNEPSE